PLKRYRDFLQTDSALFEASWPYLVNRGVFMTPGDEEQWTISVRHDEDDIARYVDAFGEFCQEVVSS
ncbi:MAG TPA: aspartate aminotransferase family protein, partial [Actinomycetota bacterium]|nr:aspartate aminotransferase family protein [Actinomycetota bacterium]